LAVDCKKYNISSFTTGYGSICGEMVPDIYLSTHNIGTGILADWRYVDGATSYQISWNFSWKQADPSNGNLITDITDANYNFNNGPFTEPFWFYVRARCSNGVSLWYGPFYNNLSCASTTFPADGAVNVSASHLELAWSPVLGSDGVEVYFGTSPDLDKLPLYTTSNYKNAGGVADYTKTLEYGTTYYWYVVPYTSHGGKLTGCETQISSFTTEPEPVPDLCDGIDNDGDGQVDEDATFTTYYADADGDGYGDPETTIRACTQPAGYVSDNTDCADNDATVYPGAPEICDGKDNNCNGQVDESAGTTWYRDSDGDGYGDVTQSTTACTQPAGYVADNTDCADNDATVYPGAPELCDGKDNNCNGQIDEGAGTTWYRDSDGDGYGDTETTMQACAQPTGYVANNTDCADNDATVHPGAPEICDEKDNNCNGQVDEGAGTTWYRDSDGDGYGDPAQSTTACAQPDSYVADNTDCADNDATVYPGAPEICDGKDNNCNGQVDDGAGNTWYRDSDGDRYGDPAQSTTACTQPAGYVSDNTDCVDNDATVYPGAPEICDGKDNNCNGQVDDGAGNTWYRDSDGDGYGDAETTIQACAQPAGYVADNTDCADNDATVHPGAPEICDGKDNNCNGQVDEGAGTTWYKDSDGDGYGDAETTIQACAQPTGYVANNTDCADNDETIHPGAPEICDGKDNNCNGQVDEGCANLPAINIANTLNLEGSSGTRNMSFILTLSRRSSVPVTVKYRTVDGTALSSEDYISKSGVITFPANSTLQVLNISVKGDTRYEESETFKVELSQPGNARLGNTEATAIIVNDDLPPFVRVQDAQATEQSQKALVRVDLTSPSSVAVIVKYETRNGTAKAPGDFSAATNATLRFEPGETTKYITIPIVWDAVKESTEQFSVYILSAENASLASVLNILGARRTATVRILNSQANNSLLPSSRKMAEAPDETKQATWEVKVQPNPFAGSFELVINSPDAEPVTVRIMDRIGRMIKTETHNWSGKPLRISANDMNPGLYFAEVTLGTHRSVLKLLKIQ
jgi:hypothetical protein